MSRMPVAPLVSVSTVAIECTTQRGQQGQELLVAAKLSALRGRSHGLAPPRNGTRCASCPYAQTATAIVAALPRDPDSSPSVRIA